MCSREVGDRIEMSSSLQSREWFGGLHNNASTSRSAVSPWLLRFVDRLILIHLKPDTLEFVVKQDF